MTSAIARQWQRVDYQMPVQLMVRCGSRAEEKTVTGRAVDLSEGGIRVRVSDPLPVGEAVTCNMLLEGKPTSLPGHVRWAKPTLEGLGDGAGIQFDRLPDDESGLLRHLVSRATRGDQPVDLYFPSMREPVRARAFATDGGLYIAAALPVLTRDTQVEFQFGGAGPRFLGSVARVAVRERERTPHLEVELAIHAHEMPRFRRYTMYGDPAGEAPDTETRQLARHDTAPGTESQRDLPTGATGRRAVQPEGATLVAADATTAPTRAQPERIAPVLRMWNPAESPEEPLPDEREAGAAPAGAHDAKSEPRVAATSSTDVRAATSMAAQLPRALTLILIGLGAALPFALVAWLVLAARVDPASITAQPRPVMQHDTPSIALIAAPEAAPATLAPVAPTVQPPSAPVAALPAEAPAAHPSAQLVPEVRVGDHATDVLIPMTGALEGARNIVWAAPSAIIIELPNAHFGAAERTYSVHAGGVSRLTLSHDTSHGGSISLARVFLEHVPLRHGIAARDGSLILHIEQDASPDMHAPRARTLGAAPIAAHEIKETLSPPGQAALPATHE